MAERLLFSAAQLMIETLGSAAVKDIGLLWGVENELEKLKGTLLTINAVLDDAEEKKKDGNNQVKVWLERLEDVFSEADDLLDEVNTEGLRRRLMLGKNKTVKKVCTFFSSSNQLVFRRKMARKIKDIREGLDGIAADRVQLRLEISHDDEAKPVGGTRETHSFVVKENVVGRVGDKRSVLDLLLDPQDKTGREKVSVLLIVGMGGLGKTTLAQLVFGDEQVKRHFDLRIWVYVSDNFDEKVLVGKIIKIVTGTSIENLEMEQLQVSLRREISEKRYLLVLDDVWNEDPRKWQNFKDLLTTCREGSKIIVTTRNETVAKLTGTMQSYYLGILGSDESWSLFKKMAFRQEHEPTDSATNVEIAEKIMHKYCGGVPLALNMIGSMLYFSDPGKDWMNFLKEGLGNIPQEENSILTTLRLSYDHLPSHLKPCFAFCTLFPKDHKIDVETLISLWIAD